MFSFDLSRSIDGDLTGHGTPLGPGPGSMNVLIGGQPAWRATSDVHTCPGTQVNRPIDQRDPARAADNIAERHPEQVVCEAADIETR